MGAAENGARVVVLDKGRIERSGDIAGGVDHFMAFLESGESWDTCGSCRQDCPSGAIKIVFPPIMANV